MCCGHSPLLSSHVPSTWLHVSWLRVCVGASSGDGEPGKWAISGLSPPHTCSLGSPDSALHPVTLLPLSCSPTWQWFRDGSPLPDGRSTYSVSNKERTLTLQSASPDDNGLYYCCARSAVGFVCSQNNFTLNIIGAFCPGCSGLGTRLFYRSANSLPSGQAAGEVSGWWDFLCVKLLAKDRPDTPGRV